MKEKVKLKTKLNKTRKIPANLGIIRKSPTGQKCHSNLKTPEGNIWHVSATAVAYHQYPVPGKCPFSNVTDAGVWENLVCVCVCAHTYTRYKILRPAILIV